MREFHELFVGRTDAYGTYVLPKGQIAKRGTKFLGKAETVSDRELTLSTYLDHLGGTTGLGVVPLIPKSETVHWFAIDVDNYTEDDLHGDLARRINKLNLPLVICKTKSGGAHLYCFLSEPCLASDVLPHAKEYVKKLRLDPKTEIFPKQVVSTKRGSWINLPYFGDTRPCMGKDGKTELSIKEFLLYANSMEVSPDDLDIRTSELEHRETSGSQAPPCIDRMAEEGIEENSGRDNALAHYVVYAKRAFPDDWQDKVMEFNSEHCTPPLNNRDMSRIIKGGERKEYQYFCHQVPMVNLCDKAACLKREFGIGSGSPDNRDEFVIDSVRVIDIPDDPIYVLVTDGVPIRMDLNSMTQYRLFRLEYFKMLKRFPKAMKQDEWENILNDIEFEIEDAPDIVSEAGQIMYHFHEWSGQRMSQHFESVMEGYPVYLEDTVSFRPSDFMFYLRRNGCRFAHQDVWFVLHNDGAYKKRKQIGPHKPELWVYPAPEELIWFDKPEAKKF